MQGLLVPADAVQHEAAGEETDSPLHSTVPAGGLALPLPGLVSRGAAGGGAGPPV